MTKESTEKETIARINEEYEQFLDLNPELRKFSEDQKAALKVGFYCGYQSGVKSTTLLNPKPN